MTATPFRVRQLTLSATLSVLTACGGGSSDNGGSDNSDDAPPASNSRLTLSTYLVERTEPVTSGANLEEDVIVTLADPESAAYTILVTFSTNGLRHVSSTRRGDELVALLQYTTPLELRPGVHEDTVRFDVCTDGSCAQLVPGLSASLTSRLTITESEAVSISVSAQAPSHHAFVTDPFFPGVEDLDITVEGAAVRPFVEVYSTNNAVVHANGGMLDVVHGTLRYDLQPPGDLGPGVYEDTITIEACLDRNCINPISPFPLVLSLRLFVTDTVDGPHGYTVRIQEETGTALAWDRTRQRLYFSRPGNDSLGDHRIIVYDPAAGNVVSTIPASWRPGPLTLSADDQHLFVGTASTPGRIKRIRLDDLAVDAEVELGTDEEGQPYAAKELAAAPAQPQLLAVARTIHVGGARTAGIVIFDAFTPRASTPGADAGAASNPAIHHVAWGADETRMFASKDTGENPEIFEISVDADGGQIARQVSAPTQGRLHFAGGLLYSDNGLVLDSTTLSQTATLVARHDGTDGVIGRIFVDADANRIYAIARFPLLDSIAFRAPTRLVSFDLTLHTQIASLPLDPTTLMHHADIVRWGHDGLALLPPPGGRLTLVNGAFVAP